MAIVLKSNGGSRRESMLGCDPNLQLQLVTSLHAGTTDKSTRYEEKLLTRHASDNSGILHGRKKECKNYSEGIMESLEGSKDKTQASSEQHRKL